MQDDSLLCDISFKSLSRSSASCTDSDCTFELCRNRMPRTKQNKLAKANHNGNKKKILPNDSVTPQRTNKPSAEPTINVVGTLPQSSPASNGVDEVATSLLLAPGSNNVARNMHRIPERLLNDSRQDVDLPTFVEAMRGNRDEIDTEAIDISLDPFASDFVWNNMESPDLFRFPDMMRLANQLGGHMKDINGKEEKSTSHKSPTNDTKMIEENRRQEQPKSQLSDTSTTRFDYVKFRSNRRDSNGNPISIEELRKTDPTLILINRAIFSSPPPLSSDLHKDAEKFAIYGSSFAKLDEPPRQTSTPQTKPPSKAPAIHTDHLTCGPSQASKVPVHCVRKSTTTVQQFVPARASTPVKSQFAQNNNVVRIGTIDPYGKLTTHPRTMEYSLNSNVMNGPPQSAATGEYKLYPQTMLMSSPNVPRVHAIPTMFSPPPNLIFPPETPNRSHFFDRYHTNMY